ncbi:MULTISPECIES: hypothetical protein [unclassified Streptomyces]|uniref:hypothetical protein n=1 Tax=unclassified Streptomyces TaxID=2593676 RepID=UPI00382DB14E
MDWSIAAGTFTSAPNRPALSGPDEVVEAQVVPQEVAQAGEQFGEGVTARGVAAQRQGVREGADAGVTRPGEMVRRLLLVRAGQKCTVQG